MKEPMRKEESKEKEQKRALNAKIENKPFTGQQLAEAGMSTGKRMPEKVDELINGLYEDLYAYYYWEFEEQHESEKLSNGLLCSLDFLLLLAHKYRSKVWLLRGMLGERLNRPRMAEKGLLMLERCLKAFMGRDADAARAICDEDTEVDVMYDQVYRELLLMMIENPKIIEGATYLIWVAHNLERIADRVTNIAERVVFMVTGKMEEINVSKY